MIRSVWFPQICRGFWAPIQTPCKLFKGFPKWEGTPEENARMLRSAMKLYGTFMLGYAPLDSNSKKLVF
ncbi:MAG: reductive dehalogenase domain-containing protein [Dehalogenimonas sp.]